MYGIKIHNQYSGISLILICPCSSFLQIHNSVSGRTVESKLSTLVDFPIHGLDMTPYLQQEGVPGGRPSEADTMTQGDAKERASKQKSSKLTGKTLWSKIKGARNWGKKSNSGVAPPAAVDMDTGSQAGELPPTLSAAASNDPIMSFASINTNKYDLYAVVNHFGGLSRGHYTATCRDTTDCGQKWHHFDDNIVTAALGRNLKTSNAYILCYTQREAGMDRAWSCQTSTCQERLSSAMSYCTDYDVGDTCHFTIDAYSMSDVESWKSVSSLTQKMKVDCCPPASQQLHGTPIPTPSPLIPNNCHTGYSVDADRASGPNSGEDPASAVKSGDDSVIDSTGRFDTLSNHPPDLLSGPAQPTAHQDAELKPSLLLDKCLRLDVQASLLALQLAAESGEFTAPSASPPKVAWVSDSTTHVLSREKWTHEVPQGNEVERNLTSQPHRTDKPAMHVAPETLL